MTDIKARFIKESFLISSDPEELYILETDASNYTMKGILKQKVNKKFHPVAFYSRKFIDAELNYEIYNKKLLIKPDKCQFFVQTVGFLGFVINPDRIKKNQSRARMA